VRARPIMGPPLVQGKHLIGRYRRKALLSKSGRPAHYFALDLLSERESLVLLLQTHNWKKYRGMDLA
jgi:hypothetical protein